MKERMCRTCKLLHITLMGLWYFSLSLKNKVPEQSFSNLIIIKLINSEIPWSGTFKFMKQERKCSVVVFRLKLRWQMN